jgi:hypothetical protein
LQTSIRLCCSNISSGTENPNLYVNIDFSF